MEGRLFLLSIWCGIYGVALRQVFRRPSWMDRTAIIVTLNSLFWATFAAMVGMLLASYSERMDQTLTYTAAFAAGGLVIGAILAATKTRDPGRRDDMLRDNLEWADTGFSAILLASVVMFFLVQAFKIPSGSMRVTFLEGDHLFVNKCRFGLPIPGTHVKLFGSGLGVPGTHVKIFRTVQPHDIVIFRFPAKSKDDDNYGKDFIKRTIATEGQEVKIINKEVYVNGQKLVEPYSQHVDDTVYPSLPMPSQEAYQKAWDKGDFVYGGNDIRDNFGPIIVPKGHIFVMGDNRDRSFDSRFWGPLDVTEVKGKALLLYWPFRRFRYIP
jgi:signal peptidase I